ncbi:MAG: iron-containing alcohol dehydrogenase, partial [Hungatella sp.]|nr:iron-containing alcohol dehydrogenase [Hungatella sp.]
GTGSEVTSYAVISDKQKGIKIPLSHSSMVPEVTILNPEFTKTLPANMIAYTGMDVLTHAIEAYVSLDGNDFTDMFAVEAARLTLQCLPVLFQDAKNVEMRRKMYSASTMAGVAFTNASLGLCHGIAHTLGAQYHIPHGKANAIVLPYVISFNAGLGKYKKDGVGKRYAEMSSRLGLQAENDTKICQMLVMAVKILCEQFGIPTSLKECGISKEDFYNDMAQNADKILGDACTKANPVNVKREDVLDLLGDIYQGELGAFIK